MVNGVGNTMLPFCGEFVTLTNVVTFSVSAADAIENISVVGQKTQVVLIKYSSVPTELQFICSKATSQQSAEN